jgi:hypothetical protein
MKQGRVAGGRVEAIGKVAGRGSGSILDRRILVASRALKVGLPGTWKVTNPLMVANDDVSSVTRVGLHAESY